MYLDHAVHLTQKSPELTVNYWNRIGFHAVLGGRHKRWGTRNALLYTADSYIEWLSLDDRETAEKAGHPLPEMLLRDRQGFGTVCLRTGCLEQVRQRLCREGFKMGEIMPAERETVSGSVIRWKLLFIESGPSGELTPPFFIEWEQNDEDRYRSLRESGSVLPENEKLKISHCIFNVRDRHAAEEEWRCLLGGTLELPNCSFEFREMPEGKDRLAEIVFSGGQRQVNFEEGHYLMPIRGREGLR